MYKLHNSYSVIFVNFVIWVLGDFYIYIYYTCSSLTRVGLFTYMGVLRAELCLSVENVDVIETQFDRDYVGVHFQLLATKSLNMPCPRVPSKHNFHISQCLRDVPLEVSTRWINCLYTCNIYINVKIKKITKLQILQKLQNMNYTTYTYYKIKNDLFDFRKQKKHFFKIILVFLVFL